MRSYDEILNVMKAEFADKAGFSPDDASDIGIRLKVLASQIYSLAVQQDWLKRQAFPQTATGQELDKHAEMRGLERKKAVKAVGQLTFYVEYPAPFDINIPAGVVCATCEEPKLCFVTTSSAVLPAGDTFVTVSAEAMEGGSRYNVAASSVTEMVTQVEGIATVRNNGQFSGGKDAESDEMLRNRLMQSYNVINGVNGDYYIREALKFDEVRSANIEKYPRGLGSLDVYVVGENGPLHPAKLEEIWFKLCSLREVSVELEVKNAIITKYNVEVNLNIDGRYNADDVKLRVKKAIEDYFKALKVGEPVLVSKLGKVVLAVEGVVDYTFVNMSNTPPHPFRCYVLDNLVVN